MSTYTENIIGRSTIDQIFVLRQILEKTREYNIDTYHIFIDFRTAYESIIRPKLYMKHCLNLIYQQNS